MKRGGTVYIMTNKHHTVFYTGVTSNLVARVHQHKTKHYPRSFTARYNADVLVYYEAHPSIMEAITREKQLKKYSRKKKVELIERMNPEWRDWYADVKGW
jgi:putative endonuclease